MTTQPQLVAVHQLIKEGFDFKYVLLHGLYSLHFRLCDMDHTMELGCEPGPGTWSTELPVNQPHPGIESSWCLTERDDLGSVDRYAPVISKLAVKFSFAFTPCHKVLPYEQAVVSLYKAEVNESESVCQNGLEILKTSLPVSAAHLVNKSADEAIVDNRLAAVIAYQVRKYFHRATELSSD